MTDSERTLRWQRHSMSQNLCAATDKGLYSITRGGENRRQFVLRYLSWKPTEVGRVLGIHDEEVHATDEAERHHRDKESSNG